MIMPLRKASPLFTIGKPLARRPQWLIGIGVFVVLGLAWYLSTASGLVPKLFLPHPADVWARVVKLAVEGTLWADRKVSLYRILLAFLVSSAMSFVVGVLVGWYGVWRSVSELLVDVVRYMHE